MGYILDKMIELGADGVDFVPITLNRDVFPQVIRSYTKRDFEANPFLPIPKTNYLFYKNVNGQKVYIER